VVDLGSDADYSSAQSVCGVALIGLWIYVLDVYDPGSLNSCLRLGDWMVEFA